MGLIFIILFCLLLFFFPIPGSFVSLYGSYRLKGKKANLLFIYAIFTLGIISVLYVPFIRNDLYRYFETMQAIAPLKNISDFLEFSKYDSTLQYQNNILFNLLEFGVAKTYHFNLLPYLITVICYGCALYPIFDLKKDEKVTPNMAFILSLGMLGIFYLFYVVNLMRWAAACAIYVFVVYIYFKKLKNSKKWIWILLIPIFFHKGIILAVVVALYIALLRNINRSKLLLPVPFFVIFLIISLTANISGASGGIFKIIRMFQGYQNIARPHSLNDWTVYILSMFAVLLFVTIAIKFSDNNRYNYVLKEMTLLFVFLSSSLQILQRYSMVIGALALVSIAENYSKIKNGRHYLMLFIMLLAIVINLYMGYLKFKGMTFTLPVNQAILSNISYYITQLFGAYY